MKNKPFNLEAALQGTPVFTRNGAKVINIHKHAGHYAEYYPIAGDIVLPPGVSRSDVPSVWCKDGNVYNTGTESPYDLFMGEDIVAGEDARHIEKFIKNIIKGPQGFLSMEEHELAIFPTGREIGVAEFVIRCLANPECEGSLQVMQAIQERRNQLLNKNANNTTHPDRSKEGN